MDLLALSSLLRVIDRSPSYSDRQVADETVEFLAGPIVAVRHAVDEGHQLLGGVLLKKGT
jgi:hypothetical protein